jgi:hypothetical protein
LTRGRTEVRCQLGKRLWAMRCIDFEALIWRCKTRRYWDQSICIDYWEPYKTLRQVRCVTKANLAKQHLPRTSKYLSGSLTTRSEVRRARGRIPALICPLTTLSANTTCKHIKFLTTLKSSEALLLSPRPWMRRGSVV